MTSRPLSNFKSQIVRLQAVALEIVRLGIVRPLIARLGIARPQIVPLRIARPQIVRVEIARLASRRPASPFAFRVPLLAVLAALLIGLAGAGIAHAQRSEEAKALSKRLMCVCGCNQVLGECNHVGCTVSTEMLRKLDERVAGGESADLILQSFVQEYGEQALAEPMAVGFNRLVYILAWVVPLAGFVIVTLVVRRWRAARPAEAPAGPRVSREILERARQRAAAETEEDYSGGSR